jgi:hypothetical protein
LGFVSEVLRRSREETSKQLNLQVKAYANIIAQVSMERLGDTKDKETQHGPSRCFDSDDQPIL